MSLQGAFILLTFFGLFAVYVLASILFRGRESSLRATILAALIVVLALFGYRWNGWAGAFVLPVLGLLFVFGSLFLASGYLFPVQGWQERWQAFLTLLSFTLDYHLSSYVIEDGKIAERVKGMLNTSGAGVILTGPTNAAVMETATRYSRIAGPGLSFTRRLEEVSRPPSICAGKARAQEIEADTKNGITVRLPVFCLFHIAPPQAPVESAADFPFSEDALQRAVYGREGGDEEDELYEWDDYALHAAISRVRETLIRYPLDQLFQLSDPDLIPREVLGDLVNNVVKNDLRDRGIEVIKAGFGAFKLPEQVQQQKITSWQAEWLARAETRRAEGEAEAESRVRNARAAAQWELVQGLINGLKTAQAYTGLESADLIAWQLLNAMERMSTDPRMRHMLPNETIKAITALREWVDRPQLP